MNKRKSFVERESARKRRAGSSVFSTSSLAASVGGGGGGGGDGGGGGVLEKRNINGMVTYNCNIIIIMIVDRDK